MPIKDNIKKYRKEKKLTQRQLSEKSGVSYSTVCKLETGEQSNPSLEIIEKIARALDIESALLLYENYENGEMKFPHDIRIFIKYLNALGYVVSDILKYKKNGKSYSYVEIKKDNYVKKIPYPVFERLSNTIASEVNVRIEFWERYEERRIQLMNRIESGIIEEDLI